MRILQGVQGRGVLGRGRLFERLAQLHLLHQEIGRHRGVGFERYVHPVQRQDVACALVRILQRLVGLVHARGPLQRRAPLGVARVREAVGMHARLDFAVGMFERFVVQSEGRLEPEELEVTTARR
jgi:hypothetical protein